MIKHEDKRIFELEKEFQEWLNNCDKLNLVNLITEEELKNIWLSKRLKRIQDEMSKM